MVGSEIQQATVDIDSSYALEDWQKGYRSLKQEFDYWIDEVDGDIPLDLHGTLFRNGPGLLDVNGQRIHHPFDGDGMICAIAFANGGAHFRNRFVRTAGFLEEQQAQQICYRGVFGTQKPGGWVANLLDFRLKNIANTNVIYWGNKLLALWEAAEPHRLDPHTLDTLGVDDLDGVLQPGSAFAAHPRIDPQGDRGQPCLVNFALKPGLSTTITLYEFNLQGTLLHTYHRAVPGFAFIHDFVLTPHYCIFFQNPVTFNPIPYALGLRGAGECITFHPQQPTRIVLIPRPGSGEASDHSSAPPLFEVEAGFVFHHANAFEDQGELYIDSICYADLPSVEPGQDYQQTRFSTQSPGQLWRFRLNLASGAVERSLLAERCCEFPTIHPRVVGQPYRYVYLGAAHAPQGNAPLQGIIKVDVQTGDRQVWSAAPHGFAGEPVFVPRPGAGEMAEDDGWLLSLFFNAEQERSELIILDARDLNRGPLARLRLNHHVPYGLHGCFTPHYFEP